MALNIIEGSFKLEETLSYVLLRNRENGDLLTGHLTDEASKTVISTKLNSEGGMVTVDFASLPRQRVNANNIDIIAPKGVVTFSLRENDILRLTSANSPEEDMVIRGLPSSKSKPSIHHPRPSMF